MKKILATLAVLSIFAFSGCSNNNEAPAPTNTPAPSPSATASMGHTQYKDGTYKAEQKDFDSQTGWKDTISITIKDGKITEVDWNGVNKNGGDDKKTQSKDGKYGMVSKGGAKEEWYLQAAKVEQELIKTQDPTAIKYNADGKTDSISGVTMGVDSFAKLAEEALSKAK